MRTTSANAQKVRAVVNDYVRKRKSGEKKSQVIGEADLLSLFLQSPDVFDDEQIVDEILSFFVAGTLTT